MYYFSADFHSHSIDYTGQRMHAIFCHDSRSSHDDLQMTCEPVTTAVIRMTEVQGHFTDCRSHTFANPKGVSQRSL